MLKCFDCNDKSVFEDLLNKCSTVLGFKGSAFLELVTCDSGEMKEINFQNRGIDKNTDVLSFPMINFTAGAVGGHPLFNKKNYPIDYDINKKSVFLGSVVINLDKVKTQAEEYGHSEEREYNYLFTHGLLHLFGYDHETENDKRLMRELEEKILA